MAIKIFNYCGRIYEIDIHILPTPLRNKEVDIILPVFNDIELFLYAVKSLKTFTTDDLYNLYILNNGSSNPECLNGLQSIAQSLSMTNKHNVGVITHKTIGVEWNGSEAHGTGLNAMVGSGLLTSKNVFLMHSDSAALGHNWLKYFLGKVNEGNVAVGTYTNWSDDQGVAYLHCSGLLVDREFAEGIDYRPNKPQYDTIGALTKKLIDTKSKYLVCKNSRNDPSLRVLHAYGQEKGSESFDDEDKPVWGHAGRGSSQGNRGGWIRDL